MLKFFLKLTRLNLYNQIPLDDALSRQRFVLFRIFSFTGFFVCLGSFFKMYFSVSNKEILPFFILFLSVALVINFYMVSSVRHLRRSYFFMLILAFLLLHIVSYSCGGIRTSGTLFFAVIIMNAFMLLGKKAGHWFTGCIAIHILFLYFISSYTNWTSFAIFNNNIQLINQDFLLNAVLSFLLVAAQSNYLHSSKNVIIQSLEKSKSDLEEKNRELVEINETMKTYASNLEKSNQELDKFASVASHDLKAPLRAIGSLAGMIEEDSDLDLGPEVQSHITTIKNRVNRMDQLLDALLEYSKADRLTGHEHTVDTLKVVEEISFLFCQSKPVNFIFSEKLPFIYTDKRKFKTIVSNLVSNAIVHNDKEVIQVKIDFTEKPESWIFSVKDNGPGIDKCFHEKIFVIFQTLKSRDTLEMVGAGLAITKKLVEEKKGKLWIESVKGNGAQFFFSIPKKQQN